MLRMMLGAMLLGIAGMSAAEAAPLTPHPAAVDGAVRPAHYGGPRHCHWRGGYRVCYGSSYRGYDGYGYGYGPGITLRFGGGYPRYRDYGFRDYGYRDYGYGYGRRHGRSWVQERFEHPLGRR